MASAALASGLVFLLAGTATAAQEQARSDQVFAWLVGTWSAPQGEVPDLSWSATPKSARPDPRKEASRPGAPSRVELTVTERAEVLVGALEAVSERGARSAVATFAIDRGKPDCPLTWREAGTRYQSPLEGSGYEYRVERGDVERRDLGRAIRFTHMRGRSRQGAAYPIIIELSRREEALILRRVQGPQHGAAVDQIFHFTRVPAPAAVPRPSSPALLPAGAEGAPSPAPPPKGEWFLVGGIHQPTVVQPHGAGRALLCNRARCDVWDAAAGTWTPTGAVVLPVNETASVARRDGTVAVVDGARTVATAVWSAASGRWTTSAALPERLTSLRLGALSDGRLLATGDSGVNRGPRAYLSTSQLDRWTVLADAPAISAALSISSAGRRLVPTPSGAVLLDGPRAWRSSVGAPEWHPVSVPVPVSTTASGDATFLQAWGDDIVRVTMGGGRWSAALIAPDQQAERPAFGGEGAGRLALRPITTSDGAGAWWAETGGRHFWARHADEAPVAVVPNGVDPGYLTVALDDTHLLEISTTGAVVQFALDGRPPPGAACSGLARYLSVVGPESGAGREAALVSPGCRAEAEGGRAPDLQRLVRGWARDEQRQGSGRAFMCALHDPLAAESLPRWLRGPQGPGRSLCLAVAATWPAVEPAYAAAIAAGVYEKGEVWWVDEALVASATTPALLDRLTPMVRAAAEHRAYGFHNLHRHLCGDQTQASADRRHACAATASLKESAWRDEEQRAKDERRNRPRRRLPRVLIATALYGGAIATAYATRDQDVARGIATGAGVIGGATLGVSLGGLAALQGNWSAKDGEGVAMMIVGGALLGGAFAGWGFHAAARAADHRAPLTAVGLFLPCLFAVVLPLD